MGTLREVKFRMKRDSEIRGMLVRGSRHEILLDVDGDGQPDVGLLDENHDGDIDALAADLTGDGEFNLYIKDTDRNGVPDAILYDEDGSGELKVIDSGDEVEQAIIAAAQRIQTILEMEDYAAARLDEALGELDKKVRQARKELKKRS